MNLAIMIKPASSRCNLACEYCFYKDLAANRAAADLGAMRPETLAALLRRAAEALPAGQATLTLLFQGGEPLLAGLEFFRRTEALLAGMARPGLTVRRGVQTNGTLIDDAWAAFFARHGYLVGVSLDGPAAPHNALRPDAGGKGSFNRAMAGIRCLERHGAAYNILSVITGEAARHGARLFRFFLKNGWRYLQFIPCADPLDGRPRPYSLGGAQYGRFLIDVFREYRAANEAGQFVSERWFDNLLGMIAGRPPEQCGMAGACACQLVVESDGGVYPCDFYADDAHRLGDVFENSFPELLAGEAARRFVEGAPPLARRCGECRWRGLCRGGCRRYRVLGADGGACNALCDGYRMFFETCGDALAEMARRASEERTIRGFTIPAWGSAAAAWRTCPPGWRGRP